MSLVEHLEKLRHFYKLSRFRSINECAQASGISQAGLSKSISALESALGADLFVRSQNGLVLTKEGTLLQQATKRIMDETTNFEINLRSIQAAKVPHRLRIGMYDSIAVYFFYDLSQYMRQIYQDVDLQLTVHTSAQLAASVKEHSLELAIGVNLDRQTSSKAEFFLLFKDHYSFYSSTRADVNVNELPLLIHPAASDENGVSVDKALSKVIASRGAHYVYNFETLKTLTVRGLGIGVLPTQVAKPLVQQNLLTSVDVARTRHLFGRHSIGFLATSDFLKDHRGFCEDIYRLGNQWAKS